MKDQKHLHLSQLFTEWSGEDVRHIEALPPSGSYREYYRLSGTDRQAIGVYNEDYKENVAFLEFTRHFLSKGLRVPQIYSERLSQNIYLLQDLGDLTLYRYLLEERQNGAFPSHVIPYYKKALKGLVGIQVDAGKDLNYELCYPRNCFDKRSMLWDLNYFKYYFLKLAKVPFDEQLLEDDFQSFTEFLLNADKEFFLYRDFQARNIMVHEGEVYFIDYQGGRKGALQYDLASLLYQSKANIPDELRSELLEHYLEALEARQPVDRDRFFQHFYGYVLMRLIQVLGAYGFRGFFEGKKHFLESIPYALKNLEAVLAKAQFPVEFPEFRRVLSLLSTAQALQPFLHPQRRQGGLTVSINSFSFKQGLPDDTSGNGGGFIFDCRAIHNPGRYPEYKRLTGRDPEVIAFFQKHSQIDVFIEDVIKMVDASIENYLDRGFSNLQVNFGCTGGQHRSVYCADQLAAHLRKQYDINISLTHIEQEKKAWIN